MEHGNIKWGILGTSFISQQMAHAISQSVGSELKAIASRDEAKSKDFAAQYSVPLSFSDYNDLLADPNVEAVYVGLPNHMHKEWTNKALEAGKHVLCEKPFALDEREVLDMMEIAQVRGLVCMEAIMYRCHPLIQEIKSVLQQGLIGNVQLIQAAYTAKIAHLANPISGGAIFNLGCYPLSLISYLSNAKPIELKAVGVPNFDNPHNDTRSIALLEFDDQSLATISVSDDLAMSWQFVVWGTEGRLEMITNPWFPEVGEQAFRLYLSGEEKPRDIRLESPLSAYTYQINTMNYLILNPTESIAEQITLEESLDNIKLLKQWRDQALA